MSTIREAAQELLAAIDDWPLHADRYRIALAALRAALAAEQEQEPVAWTTGPELHGLQSFGLSGTMWSKEGAAHTAVHVPLYAAPAEAERVPRVNLGPEIESVMRHRGELYDAAPKGEVERNAPKEIYLRGDDTERPYAEIDDAIRALAERKGGA